MGSYGIDGRKGEDMATVGKKQNGLWRIKPVNLILRQSDQAEHGLKRTLGPISLTAMGIGAIVGTGIFVLTGVAAAKYAGPGLMISFVIAGIVSGLAALCYAEFASSVPISGSAYTYSYATPGELIAWIIGWDLILCDHPPFHRLARHRATHLLPLQPPPQQT
jgi:APA family basic amino acid/polyamine antiporter